MSISDKLRGVGVALVTPFMPDNTIDYDSLGRLVDYQIKAGADYLVVLGTTSEAPTLSPRRNAAPCAASWPGKQPEGCLWYLAWEETTPPH